MTMHAGRILGLLLVAAAVGGVEARGAERATPKPEQAAVNLVSNGDFEKLDEQGFLPVGWTTRHPDNLMAVPGGGQRGNVIEMTGGRQLMGTYGTDLLSPKIPFKANTRYRCTGYTRSDGPSMIVFVKGYATVHRRVDGEMTPYDDAVYQMKKQIKPTAEWTKFNLDFDVMPARIFSDFQHEVKYLRILLWAYWPPGTCWYDDIRFEEVGPLPAPEAPGSVSIEKPLTHTGERPRLGPGADDPDQPAAFDAEQTWVDAANAFNAGELDRALELAEALVARQPHHGGYRLLSARAAARLGRRDIAAEHVQWLLDPANSSGDDPPVRPWQALWAHVVEARLLADSGEVERAKALLSSVLADSDSPHVRHAAGALLEQLGATERSPVP